MKQAIEENNIEMVSEILSKDPNVRIIFELPEGSTSLSPLQYAAIQGKIDICILLFNPEKGLDKEIFIKTVCPVSLEEIGEMVPCEKLYRDPYHNIFTLESMLDTLKKVSHKNPKTQEALLELELGCIPVRFNALDYAVYYDQVGIIEWFMGFEVCAKEVGRLLGLASYLKSNKVLQGLLEKFRFGLGAFVLAEPYASFRGNTEGLQLLMDRKFAVSGSVLLVAVEKSHIGCVEILLKHKVNRLLGDEQFANLIFNLRMKEEYALYILLAKNATEQQLRNPLVASIVADLDANKYNILKRVIDFGDVEGLRIALQWLDLEAILDELGYTALMYAVSSKKNELIPFLLNTDRGVNARNKFVGRQQVPVLGLTTGNTALSLAVIIGNLEAVKLLMAAGADPSIQNSVGYTSITMAVNDRQHACLKELVKDARGIDVIDSTGISPLLHAVLLNDLVSVEILLMAGASLSLPGVSAIYVAVQEKKYDCLRLLVSQKKDLDVKHEHGFTALMKAVLDKDVISIKILLEANADLKAKTRDNTTILMLASQASTEVMDLIMAQEGVAETINEKNDRGCTALFYAVSFNLRGVDKLLEMGADVNMGDDIQGLTPLMAAIITGASESIIDQLLDAGADFDKKDNKGFSAMDGAVRYYKENSDDIYIKLLVRGKIVYLEDEAGCYKPMTFS